MTLKFNKQYGAAMVNLLRQATMAAVSVVRPIAFSVGASSNVIDTSNAMVEDMTEFIHNVMELNYFMPADNAEMIDKPIVFDSNVTTGLSSSQFNSVNVMSHDNIVLANLLNPTNVRIVFRNSSGHYSAKENVEFLRNHSIDTDALVVVPSRHCPVDSFKINEEASEYDYTANISIDTNVSTEEAILYKAADVLRLEFENLCKKLQNS